MNFDFLFNYFGALFVSIASNLMFIADYFDDRHPIHPANKQKYRLPKDSLLRSIFKIKDTNDKPCIMSKLILCVVSGLILCVTALIYLLDVIGKGWLRSFIITLTATNITFAYAIIAFLIAFIASVIYSYQDYKYYNKKKRK